MTEQGEVLATKYGTRAVAHRELELAASSVLASAGPDGEHSEGPRRARMESVMDDDGGALGRGLSGAGARRPRPRAVVRGGDAGR